jgi:hypothetical protein
MSVLKRFFKIALWLLAGLVVFYLYLGVIVWFSAYPEWIRVPVYWLDKKFELSADDLELIAVMFLATFHLAVIAIVASLSYAVFRYWKKKH